LQTDKQMRLKHYPAAYAGDRLMPFCWSFKTV